MEGRNAAAPPAPAPKPQSRDAVRSSGEYSSRPHKHKDDEKGESEDVGQFGAKVIGPNGDDLAHHKSGDKAADHVAQAAKHADHEKQRPECIADEGMHVI